MEKCTVVNSQGKDLIKEHKGDCAKINADGFEGVSQEIKIN